MAELTTVSFGPQHPVLPEPIHLDLELKDEKVVRAVPSIGYVHRGLEKLVEKRDFKQFIYVAERVCGICSFGHGWGYAKAVEGLMEIDVPRRASYLRTIWHELSRLHSHLLWLGLGADALGFESLFMHCWRLRETILDIFEETTGGRVIFSVCEVGGVRRDLTDAMKKSIEERLTGLTKEIEEMASVFLYDDTIQTRLEGVGILSMNEAMDLGCVGRWHAPAASRMITVWPMMTAHTEISDFIRSWSRPATASPVRRYVSASSTSLSISF